MINKIAKQIAFFTLILLDAITRCDVVGVFASIFLSAMSFKIQPTERAKNEQTRKRKKFLNVRDFEKANPKKHGMNSKIVPI